MNLTNAVKDVGGRVVVKCFVWLDFRAAAYIPMRSVQDADLRRDRNQSIFSLQIANCALKERNFSDMTTNGVLSNKTISTPSKDAERSSDAATAATAVLKHSIPMPSTSTQILGVDFNNYTTSPITVAQLTSHFSRTGFQASNLGRACEIINNMVLPP
jgi:hypothetical protein